MSIRQTSAMHQSKPSTRYKKVKLAGKGSFGKVWVVSDPERPQEFFIAKELRFSSKQEKQEAFNEARIHSKLSHRHIVRYKEVINAHKSRRFTIIMQYGSGGDLSTKVQERLSLPSGSQHFPETQILRWFVQMCEALLYVHDQSIIHRDIKTANLFLDDFNNLLLGDFGISKELEGSERMSARKTRTPIGTPMMLSPELCSGRAYTTQADAWACGCVLYELCSLKPAFQARSIQRLMQRIRRGHFSRHFPSQYSSDLKNLVHALLRIDPKQRPKLRDILQYPFLQPYRSSSQPTEERPCCSPEAATESISCSLTTSDESPVSENENERTLRKEQKKLPSLPPVSVKPKGVMPRRRGRRKLPQRSKKSIEEEEGAVKLQQHIELRKRKRHLAQKRRHVQQPRPKGLVNRPGQLLPPLTPASKDADNIKATPSVSGAQKAPWRRLVHERNTKMNERRAVASPLNVLPDPRFRSNVRRKRHTNWRERSRLVMVNPSTPVQRALQQRAASRKVQNSPSHYKNGIDVAGWYRIHPRRTPSNLRARCLL